MIQSLKTMWVGEVCRMAQASAPLVATTTSWPSRLTIVLTSNRTTGSSSTTRVFTG